MVHVLPCTCSIFRVTLSPYVQEGRCSDGWGVSAPVEACGWQLLEKHAKACRQPPGRPATPAPAQVVHVTLGSLLAAAKAREFVWSFELQERTGVDMEFVIYPAFFPVRRATSTL